MRVLRRLVPAVASALCLLSSSVTAHFQETDNVNSLSLVENPVIHTPSHRVHALSKFDITFDLHQRNQRIKLSLEPNHDILADDAQVVFLNSEGNVHKKESIHRHHHRVFKGRAWFRSPDGIWERAGWARVTVREDGPDPLFEGSFSVFHDHHHLMLRSTYMRKKSPHDPHLDETNKEYMLVFRDSDRARSTDSQSKRSLKGRSCGTQDLKFNADPEHPVFKADPKPNQSGWGAMDLDSLFGFTKRQNDFGGGGGRSPTVNLRDTIGQTAGCPTTRKVALVGVATDCSYTNLFDSEEDTRRNVISVVNSASEVFESSFNVTLGLKTLTVINPDDSGSCPTTPPSQTPWSCSGQKGQTMDIQERLNSFSQWRADQDDDNAFWTLMTACSSGSEVGLAWLGQLCTSDLQGGSSGESNDGSEQAISGANVVVNSPTEWQVYVHEAAHIFGAVHDCNEELCQSPNVPQSSQCCPLSSSTCDADARFLMNPSSGDEMEEFSPCTIGNVCSAMGRSSVSTECLSNNRNVDTLSGSQCGNGIVEEGEDCDCGGTESCDGNECCNPETCKFTQGSVCDDSNEECCSNCNFASSDTVCREGNGSCDPEEKCPGDSSTCPEDDHQPDGEGCGDGLACASGHCTSRDDQCKSVMGSALGSNDTYACDESSCTLQCSSPELGRNTCAEMMQNFIDGTPCAAGGTCQNGRCEGASIGNEITSWIDDHKPLVIGLSAGIGGLILISFLVCAIRRCRRKPKRHGMAPLHNVGNPPPPMQQQWPSHRGSQAPWPNSHVPPPPFPDRSGIPQSPPTFRYA